MNMKLRQADLSDLEEIQQLFVETIESTCKSDYTKEQIEVWTSSVNDQERWKGFLKEQFFLIAESENKIVGFGSLESGKYLDFMYVGKDYLRQGVASILYQELKKESERLGFRKMESDVSKTARPFFEARGFKVVRENKNIINGIEIINYRMTQ